MKRARRAAHATDLALRRSGPYAEVPNQFVRGCVAAGLLTALQDRPKAGAGGRRARARLVKRTLQGGTALASGVATANALECRRYGAAAVTLLAGVLGVAVLEHVFDDSTSLKDEDHG